ncbi:neural proliferation differentiation and control protein 1-like [Xyrauchen texanus]|uniref:neural proliferation differentiation and control protein 1-like n=1 Tax=Xyrauchen texanus TaxID=154827 RepID=UPI002241EACF|nr:neural proliferation differentiation and control protein 1-like [Xyrauchen texanus]
MLFSPSRSARRSRASLLLPGVLISIILAAASASVPAHKCPDHIDCARMGRLFCKPGSSHCGPCLSPLEEDEVGHCVAHRRHHPQHYLHGKELSLPDVDEEIDYLSSVIAKQQMSDVKQPGSPSQSSSQTSESRQKSMSHTTTLKPTTSGPSTPTHQNPKLHTDSSNRRGPIVNSHPSRDSLLVLMISLCVIMGTIAIILVAVCWVRLQRETNLAQKVDYPTSHAAGPNNSHTSSGDKTLAHSAQMYHYQHKKHQMLSMEKKNAEPKVSESGATSDEETEEGDFTVYECPGLAPTGEMEVKNPLFDDSNLHSQRKHK